ncbi:MAG: hypothetical protein J0I47_00595 [Sphingomonas sp.]|uniref:hypothetical protein n=1 Tax=Sphingomonas sp. TaxID=28214 RepID=UPI001AC16BD9|nr:hypothetical protein [Sphingomonas sp.]MBN8806727.1 hypothetical protein [Sphingomonas sp.]
MTDDLFTSPDHFLHSFDGPDAIFVEMDRDAYHRSIFLDGRISLAAEGSRRRSITELIASSPPALPVGWIFHMAHCGSTLLARALDDPASNIIMREPVALRQTAIIGDRTRLPMVVAMLSKRYRADAPTIIKANVPVNFLLDGLIELDPSAPAIFLHCELRDYLLAILRSDGHRAWLRTLTTRLAQYLGDLSGSSDARRVAALWLAQTRAFASAVDTMPRARVIETEAFFAAPAPIIERAAQHLGICSTKATIDATINGGLLATYSKDSTIPFDNDARLARRAALEVVLAPEIAEAQELVDQAGGKAAANRLAEARLAM